MRHNPYLHFWAQFSIFNTQWPSSYIFRPMKMVIWYRESYLVGNGNWEALWGAVCRLFIRHTMRTKVLQYNISTTLFNIAVICDILLQFLISSLQYVAYWCNILYLHCKYAILQQYVAYCYNIL